MYIVLAVRRCKNLDVATTDRGIFDRDVGVYEIQVGKTDEATGGFASAKEPAFGGVVFGFNDDFPIGDTLERRACIDHRVTLGAYVDMARSERDVARCGKARRQAMAVDVEGARADFDVAPRVDQICREIQCAALVNLVAVGCTAEKVQPMKDRLIDVLAGPKQHDTICRAGARVDVYLMRLILTAGRGRESCYKLEALRSLGFTLEFAGDAYLRKKQYSEAKKKYQEAIDLYKKTDHSLIHVAQIKNNISLLFLQEMNTTLLQAHQKSLMDLEQESQVDTLNLRNIVLLSDLYAHTGQALTIHRVAGSTTSDINDPCYYYRRSLAFIDKLRSKNTLSPLRLKKREELVKALKMCSLKTI